MTTLKFKLIFCKGDNCGIEGEMVVGGAVGFGMVTVNGVVFGNLILIGFIFGTVEIDVVVVIFLVRFAFGSVDFSSAVVVENFRLLFDFGSVEDDVGVASSSSASAIAFDPVVFAEINSTISTSSLSSVSVLLLLITVAFTLVDGSMVYSTQNKTFNLSTFSKRYYSLLNFRVASADGPLSWLFRRWVNFSNNVYE